MNTISRIAHGNEYIKAVPIYPNDGKDHHLSSSDASLCFMFFCVSNVSVYVFMFCGSANSIDVTWCFVVFIFVVFGYETNDCLVVFLFLANLLCLFVLLRFDFNLL